RAQREAAESGAAEENLEQHAASVELDAAAAQDAAEALETEAAHEEQERASAEPAVIEDAVPGEQPVDEAAEQAAHEVEMEHHEGAGPMPLAGVEAQAPGAAVVAESHSEWRDHVEEEENTEKNSASADESESEGD